LYTIAFATTIDDVGLELETNMFGVEASIKESSQALVIGELSLFMKLSISSSPCVDPVTWWCVHEGQFQKVKFFNKIDSWNPKFTN